MLPQAEDFRAESEALYQLLRPVAPARFAAPTQFKGWTINHVLAHLHVWNIAADLSLRGEFEPFFARVTAARAGGMRAFEQQEAGGLVGHALLEEWRRRFNEVADRFAAADPKARVKWAGPDMSVRSSITARLMETWAHGQEVYDSLGEVRRNADRIQNICVLGINTFGWTFTNRGLPVPADPPHVHLTAPSGAVWEFNPPQEDNRVRGLAEEFCQVVTQTRNIADTTLEVRGETAIRWMAIAQCFAGPPEDPPAPGTRHTARAA